MDGIKRSSIDTSVSISSDSANESPAEIGSKPNGLLDVPDLLEPAQAAPDWTSGNQHDPGITTLELDSFLAEPLLHRADQIAQRSPQLLDAATKIAKPFYSNVLHTMSASDAGKDASIVQDEISKVSDQTTTYANLGSLQNVDIEALCFLVLMQAAKSAQEDLKAIMAEVKSMNEQKAGYREVMQSMRSSDGAVHHRVLTSVSDALAIYEGKLSSDDDDD